MKYIVEEIQTFDTGTIATPAYSYDTHEDAEAKFLTLAAGAVKSALPKHTIVWFTDDGRLVDRRSYTHVQPEPEPTPEPEEDEPTEE